MLEYVFFAEETRSRFVDFLNTRVIDVQLAEADGLLVGIPEDIDDELAEQIDELYDELQFADAALLEASEDGLEKQAAGVRIQLRNGDACTVRIATGLMGRLLASLSPEELRDLVQDIARQVEDPDDLPICHVPDKTA